MPSDPSRPPIAAAWRAHLGGAAIYAALAVLLTLPLATQFGDAVAGNGLDMWIFPWATWWARESVATGQSPFFTPLLYFPHGADLAFSTLALPITGWSVALPDTVPSGVLYNGFVLLALLLSALGGYALALHVAPSVPAAFIAGLIYGFTPNRLDQARAHLDCAFGAFLPLTLLFALRASAASGARVWWNAAAAGAMLAGGLLTRLEHAVAAAYLLGFCLLIAPALSEKRLPWRGLRIAAAIAAVGLLLALPYVLEVAASWPPPDPPNGYRAEWSNTSIALDRLATPAPTSVLWNGLSRESVAAAAEQRAGQLGFLGFSVIGLIGFGLYICGRDRRWWFWIASGAFALLLALGPLLIVREQSSGIPLPFEHLPLLGLARAPNRFLPAAVLCLAIASAIAWARWLAQGERPLAATVLLAVIVIADQAMLPFPTTRPEVSPFYHRLAASRDRSALVEVPSNPRVHDKLYLYFQTVHGRPIQAGHISRPLAGTDAYIRAVPLLHAFADSNAAPVIDPSQVRADLSRLGSDGFGYLVFHKSFGRLGLRGIDAREQAMQAAVARLRGAPIYEDDQVVAYDLRGDAPSE